jgi:hypothetical protein
LKVASAWVLKAPVHQHFMDNPVDQTQCVVGNPGFTRKTLTQSSIAKPMVIQKIQLAGGAQRFEMGIDTGHPASGPHHPG